MKVGIKVGWPRVKVPNIMVWGYKFSTLHLTMLSEYGILIRNNEKERDLMTLVGRICDFFGLILLGIFVLAWIDIGQGAHYTWWGLFHYLGNL